MTVKQLGGLMAPDGSQYVTLTDGAGNLASISALSSASSGAYQAIPVVFGIGYAPGDSITIAGGTTSSVGGYISNTILNVTDTQVITVTLNAAGTGGTPGPVTITGTTGGAGSTKFQATGTISAGGNLQAGLVVTVAGDYVISNPTLTGEPITGGGLTGATVNLTLGVLFAAVQNPGNYTSLPPTSPATQGSTSGTGTGATFTLGTGLNAAFVLPASNNSIPLSAGNETTRYGFKSLTSVTTGVENTSFGWNSGPLVTTGNNNSLFGVSTGLILTAGNNNSAFGTDALRSQTTNQSSSAFGSGALQNVNANQNCAFGKSAGQGAGGATGAQNSIFGTNSLAALAAGSNNSVFGFGAGTVINSGSNNTVIGNAVASTTLQTGARNILIGTASNTDTTAAGTNDTIVIGNSTTTTPWLTGSLVAASPSAVFSGTVKTLVTVVASLPAAATAGIGARAFITDGSTTLILGLGLTAAGGGANKVPVYSDGTNWIVG